MDSVRRKRSNCLIEATLTNNREQQGRRYRDPNKPNNARSVRQKGRSAIPLQDFPNGVGQSGGKKSMGRQRNYEIFFSVTKEKKLKKKIKKQTRSTKQKQHRRRFFDVFYCGFSPFNFTIVCGRLITSSGV